MPVIDIYPDSGTGNDTVDGYVSRNNVNETFNQVITGVGTVANTSSPATLCCGLRASSTSNRFFANSRGIFTFDTNLGNVTLNSARLTIKSATNGVIDLGDAKVTVVGVTPNSFGTIVTGDYSDFGSTLYSNTERDLSAIATDTKYNWFLNSTGRAAVDLNGKTALGVMLDWDREATFNGTWSSGDETSFYCYYADATDVDDRPFLRIDYTPNTILVPILMDIDSLTDTESKSLRVTQGSSTINSTSTNVLDSTILSLLYASMAGTSDSDLSIKSDKNIQILVQTVSDTEILYKRISSVFSDIASLTDFDLIVNKDSNITLTSASGSSLSLTVEQFQIIRSVIDALSSVDPQATRGKIVSTISESVSNIDLFIRNIPVNFTLDVNSVSDVRSSFIVPVIVNTLISSLSGVNADIIFGLIEALLPFTTEDYSVQITDGAGNVIEFLEDRLTNIKATFGGSADMIPLINWVTLIHVSMDAEGGVDFSFAKLKRAEVTIDGVSSTTITAKGLNNVWTDIISNSDVVSSLIRETFGTTNIDSLSNVILDESVTKKLSMVTLSESNVDLIAKGVMNVLTNVDSISDVVSELSPLRYVTLDVAAQSDVNLIVINELKAILNISSDADLVSGLNAIKEMALNIDAYTSILAYIRGIVAPFTTIIVRFDRDLNIFAETPIVSNSNVIATATVI